MAISCVIRMAVVVTAYYRLGAMPDHEFMDVDSDSDISLDEGEVSRQKGKGKGKVPEKRRKGKQKRIVSNDVSPCFRRAAPMFLVDNAALFEIGMTCDSKVIRGRHRIRVLGTLFRRMRLAVCRVL